MKRLKTNALLLPLLIAGLQAQATPQPIESIFNEMGGANKELENAKLNVEFKKQSLRGSKSRLWPTLSLTSTATKSDGGVAGPSTNLSTGVGSAGGSLSNQSAGSTTNLNANDGHVTQLSLGYFLFAKNSITEDINMSGNDLKSAEISQTEAYDNKKAQFLQVLMEWQLLHSVKPTVLEASEMISSVEKFAKGRSRMLYTRADRIQLEEKVAKIEYQKTRVLEGLDLAESALISMLPTLDHDKIAALPKIQVDYPLPERQNLTDKYWQQSRADLKNELLVENAHSYNRASEWNAPWVPSVYLSTSYSHSSDYEAENTNTGGSASVVFSFNLFDGFYTQARMEQSRVAVDMAKNKKSIEGDKRILALKHKRMTAQVAQADFKVKNAVSKEKELLLADVRKKVKSGIGTKLELAARSLDYVQAQMDALNSLKEYQQAMLDVAVELNEWNKVTINEVK